MQTLPWIVALTALSLLVLVLGIWAIASYGKYVADMFLPVPDAVIFATRLDMAPDAMEEMVTKVTPVPAGEPGNYSFKARFSMEGRWQLSLGAKVQGETGTVDNKLVITATR